MGGTSPREIGMFSKQDCSSGQFMLFSCFQGTVLNIEPVHRIHSPVFYYCHKVVCDRSGSDCDKRGRDGFCGLVITPQI